MSNPFEARFTFECPGCSDEIATGDAAYAHEGKYYCYECALRRRIMCACENYKSPEYPECFQCSQTLINKGIPF